MVVSTSPRSDSPSVVDAANDGGGTSRGQNASKLIVIHGHVPEDRVRSESESRRPPAAGRLGLTPQNARASRARRANAASLSAVSTNDGYPPASLSAPAAPSSSQPSSSPKAAARARGPMPVAVITGAAVGAVVFLVVALALIYFFRIRRRVHTMKKCTNILGPELAPTSPCKSSRLSFESLVKSDRTLVLSSSSTSTSTSDPSRRFLPLASPIVYPPATVDRPSQRLPPIPISTIVVGPPPPRRLPGVPTAEPRSPPRSSPVTLSWPSPTPQSPS